MKRSSGILMHISSLPNSGGIGSLGKEAYHFVDFLTDCNQTYWQILPLGPTGLGNSPYQCYSAFAGNFALIGLDLLVDEALITAAEVKENDLENTSAKVDFVRVLAFKKQLLQKAYQRFKDNFQHYKDDYYSFLGEHSWWLDDYALFCAIKAEEKENCWNTWTPELRSRDKHYLSMVFHKHAAEIEYYRFVQFIFFRQWFQLKNYANSKGILIFGDMPLYVALDSADVWANQKLFSLDEEGQMTLSAGVPPDYFSETGQLWGCPVYNWKELAERNYDWFLARLHFNLHLYDLIRIDHFRGLESYWAVDADEKDAVKGKWYPAKGYEVLEIFKKQLGKLPVVAEDLGIITPEVTLFRKHFKLPGMKVLQFAYAADEKDLNLPHNFDLNSVVYTGTHDNDTTIGWLKKITTEERKNLNLYFPGIGITALNRKIIETAWASVAVLSIIPMQDLLELDGSARMNTPGTAIHNWEWQMTEKLPKKGQIDFLKEITLKYNRSDSGAKEPEN